MYKLLLISEPSIDRGLGWGSVSVEWMNEPQESSPGLWTQMPCKARQTIQMNGAGDGNGGNDKEDTGAHVPPLKGQPLLSHGHLPPCGNVDHLLPHLIF